MKKIYIIFCLLSLSCATFGQIFEDDPSGGKLREYFSTQIHYPKEILKDSIRGNVIVRFAIDVDGSVVDAELVRGLHPLLDAEILKAIESMPKWTTRLNQGKNNLRRP